MKYPIIRFILMVAAIAVLTGCAQQHNVQLSENFWQDKNQKVAIAAFKAPEPQVHRVGGEGLVDLAVNSAMNKNMNNALKRTDLSWYDNMDSTFADRLKEHKINTSVLPKQFESSKKNREIVLRQAEGDKVLTLELRAVGARRTYYGFIPTGAPEAYCVLVGELFDPKDKKVLWHHETEIIQPVQGAWDQSPHYPNFTKALNVAVNDAKQEMLDSFFSGR